MAGPRAFSAYAFPPVDDATLTCVGVRLDGDAVLWIDAATPFATERERVHAQRFARAKDAARHLVGRALVRRTLGAVRNCAGKPFLEDFSCTPWGKPVCSLGTESWKDAKVPPRAMDFSITHSGAMVWAAFCRTGRVGIDVEESRPVSDIEELAAQLHPHEREAISAYPVSERAGAFYRCWTRKEAVLKALGMGLSLPLHSFQVRAERADADWLVSLPQEEAHDRAAMRRAAAPPAQYAGREQDCVAWTTRDLGVGSGYQCSVAAAAPRLSLAVFLLGSDIA